MLQTPQIFRRLAFRKRTLEEELQQARQAGGLWDMSLWPAHLQRSMHAACCCSNGFLPLLLLIGCPPLPPQPAGAAARQHAQGVWRHGPLDAGPGPGGCHRLGHAVGIRSAAVCWVSGGGCMQPAAAQIWCCCRSLLNVAVLTAPAGAPCCCRRSLLLPAPTAAAAACSCCCAHCCCAPLPSSPAAGPPS